MDNLELIGIEHHRVLFAAGKMGQQFRMPRIVMPAKMQRFFIQRRSGYGFHLA